MVRFGEPKAGTGPISGDAELFHLAARLRVAEQTHDEAMAELAQAEQRFSQLSRAKDSPRIPTWFVAAERREAAAGNALEIIYRQIAQAPAETKIGVSIKLRIVMLLYGESIDETESNNDVVLVLLHSLLTDCSEF